MPYLVVIAKSEEYYASAFMQGTQRFLTGTHRDLEVSIENIKKENLDYYSLLFFVGTLAVFKLHKLFVYGFLPQDDLPRLFDHVKQRIIKRMIKAGRREANYCVGGGA